MKKEKIYKIITFGILAIISAIALLNPIQIDKDTFEPALEEEIMKGEITNVKDAKLIESIQGYQGMTKIQEIEILISEGSLKNQTITIENDNDLSINNREYFEGDKVFVVNVKKTDGTYKQYISDFIRTDKLLILFICFIIVVISLSRWQGFSSLLGMGFSFIIIFKVILPMILNGVDPILTAIFGSALILPAIFFLSHGINKKTIIAIVGTFLTLIITGLLAKIFVAITHLSGYSSEEAMLLSNQAKEMINFKGLLLAGVIIGILGVLDDITISQASITEQLIKVNKNLKFTELYSRAMKVGRDHTSSMINTLVLVYTGASLPLLLLFLDTSQSLLYAINFEFMAEEIVNTLVGSIGLLLAVPITTLIACKYLKPKK